MHRFLVDENIPQAKDAFAPLGEVELAPGRGLTVQQVWEKDALIVRSVTKAGRNLLEGSAVQFVATATAGTDHVDQLWLAERGIAFASAAGSNARSVVEYVIAALLEVEGERIAEALAEGARPVIGIVGHGRIGSQLAKLLPVLGFAVVACDPPLARAGERDANGNQFIALEDLLAASDVVTCHVPLVSEGIDRTVGLLSERMLMHAKLGARIVNSSRGDVVDGAALLAAVRDGRLAAPILDVWENEPEIDAELFAASAIATPHIAGYSHDGKMEGTRMVAEAAARHFGMPFLWRPHLEPPPDREILLRGESAFEDLKRAVKTSYDIAADDARLRAEVAGEPLAKRFDRLRKEYPMRREFAAYAAVGSALANRIGFPESLVVEAAPHVELR